MSVLAASSRESAVLTNCDNLTFAWVTRRTLRPRYPPQLSNSPGSNPFFHLGALWNHIHSQQQLQQDICVTNFCHHIENLVSACSYTWVTVYNQLHGCHFAKLIGLLQVRKFSAFKKTQRFITVFTRACHLSLSSARWYQSVPSIPVPLTSVNIILLSMLTLSVRVVSLINVYCYTNICINSSVNLY